MSVYEVGITNGPSKAALQTLLKKDQQDRQVTFDTEEGRFEARLAACQDLEGQAAPGVVIRGRITSGPYQGRSFIGTYCVITHTGSLNLDMAPRGG
jgi:hypothetical protein